MSSTCRLVFGIHLVFCLVHVTQEACPLNCASCRYYMNASICTLCASGYYGKDCSNTCSSTCKDADCYDYSGHCKACQAGWYTQRCKKRCRSSCKWDICLFHSGHCLECEDGRHGSFCEKTCARCYNGICDRKTGICIMEQSTIDSIPSSSDDDRNNSSVFVYSFVSVMVTGILIGLACAVHIRMKDRKKAERSFSEAKAEMLIQDDQRNDQRSSDPVRSDAKCLAQNQSESTEPLVYITEPSPKPSTSSYRRRSSDEPLVRISDPTLDNADECLRNEDYFVPTSYDVCNSSANRYRDDDAYGDTEQDYIVQADDCDMCTNPSSSILQDTIADVPMDMSSISVPNQDISQERPMPKVPPPHYENLFPPS